MVVSNEASSSTLKPTPFLSSVFDDLVEARSRSRQPIQLRHDEHVTLMGKLKRLLQLGSRFV